MGLLFKPMTALLSYGGGFSISDGYRAGLASYGYDASGWASGLMLVRASQAGSDEARQDAILVLGQFSDVAARGERLQRGVTDIYIEYESQ
jgi:hypothetical protein